MTTSGTGAAPGVVPGHDGHPTRGVATAAAMAIVAVLVVIVAASASMMSPRADQTESAGRSGVGRAQGPVGQAGQLNVGMLGVFVAAGVVLAAKAVRNSDLSVEREVRRFRGELNGMESSTLAGDPGGDES